MFIHSVPGSPSNVRREVSDMFGLFHTKKYKDKCLAVNNLQNQIGLSDRLNIMTGEHGGISSVTCKLK